MQASYLSDIKLSVWSQLTGFTVPSFIVITACIFTISNLVSPWITHCPQPLVEKLIIWLGIAIKGHEYFCHILSQMTSSLYLEKSFDVVKLYCYIIISFQWLWIYCSSFQGLWIYISDSHLSNLLASVDTMCMVIFNLQTFSTGYKGRNWGFLALTVLWSSLISWVCPSLTALSLLLTQNLMKSHLN